MGVVTVRKRCAALATISGLRPGPGMICAVSNRDGRAARQPSALCCFDAVAISEVDPFNDSCRRDHGGEVYRGSAFLKISLK